MHTIQKSLFGCIVLALSFQSIAGPKYKVDPIDIPYSQVEKYWKPKKAIEEKNHKVVSEIIMGCKVIYLENEEKTSPLYLDMKFTIDSKGKQYDLEILKISEGMDKQFLSWAKPHGLSPTYKFKPMDKKNKQPIISIKRLYFVDNKKTCAKYQSDGYLFSNRSITITKGY